MFNFTNYDSIDIVFDMAEQQADDEFGYEVELEWIKSLIRKDHPYLDETDVEILAQCRYETNYYGGVDF